MPPKQLLCLGALSFGAVGIAVVLPGALLPTLIERLTLSFTSAGMLLAVQPFGHLVAALTLPRAFGRVRLSWLVSSACFSLAMALAALGWAASWNGAVAAMAFSGAGIGALEVATNTLVLRAAKSPNRMLNLTHLFFGITSVATPALSTMAINAGVPWRSIWIAASLLVAVPGFAWLVVVPSQYKLVGHPGTSPTGYWNRSVVLALAISMGMYVGAEIGFGSWYTKYVVATYGLPLSVAGSGLALYWAGLTGGRLLLGFVAPGHGQMRILIIFSSAAGTLAVAALLASNAYVFATCMALLGATLAGIFPGILAVAGRWYPHALPAVTGVLLAGAGSGQIVFPLVMATMADKLGLGRAMWLYPMLCFSLVAALLTAEGRVRRSAQVQV